MEFVDKFNNKKIYINKISKRGEETDGEYVQSVHTWIMNDKNEFLLQKRSPNKLFFPNMWSQTGGAVQHGETPLDAALRECHEELGIIIALEEIEFMLSCKRDHDFVDVYLVKKNLDLNTLILQEDEVSEVNFFTIEEIKNLIKENQLATSIPLYLDMLITLLDYHL